MYSKGEPNGIQIFKNNVFPRFCGGVLNFDFHEWIQYILQKVGSGVTPLALVSWDYSCVLKVEANIGGFGIGTSI
jgi:hypothetical protein